MMRRVVASGSLSLSVLLGLSACSLFGSDAPKPKPLVPVEASMAARVVWTARMGSVDFPMTVATAGDRFTVADSSGVVAAFRGHDGAELWRASVGDKLSAGVGSDGRYAAVVTRTQELVVLDGGQVVWRKALPSPVHTAPLVAGERVFVQGVDRVVQAFDVSDGRKLWDMRRPGDALLLAHPGALLPYKDTLVVGQGPRLAGVDPLRGTLRWEVNLANPRGTNEVERLADVVGPLVRVGDFICGRAFQSAVGCVNATRGNLVWNRQSAGAVGVGADAEAVVGVDALSRVSAWRTTNGESLWTTEDYQYRQMTAPMVHGKVAVIGDFEGTVHFLDRSTGKPQLRVQAGSSPLVSQPVVSGSTILVVAKDGGLHALKTE